MAEGELLKKDLFGEIRRVRGAHGSRIVRDASTAAIPVRWLARWLLRREARALAALGGIDGIPRLLDQQHDRLEREYIEGKPMHEVRPRAPGYFRQCARQLRRMHRAGVAHNDLAKEPNLLVRSDGSPAFVDFQLATHTVRRGWLFRVLAWDDVRHVLKHKRSYCPQSLTERQHAILARPSLPSRVFRATVKPVYLLVTRRLFGWADREGAGDRGEHR